MDLRKLNFLKIVLFSKILTYLKIWWFFQIHAQWKYDLNLTFLSKKVIKLWLKDKEYLSDLQSLLLGNVVKIELKNKSKKLTKENLKFLLDQKDFNLQFISWNQQLYRKEKLTEYFTLLNSNENLETSFLDKGLVESFQKSILLKGLFIIKHHY